VGVQKKMNDAKTPNRFRGLFPAEAGGKGAGVRIFSKGGTVYVRRPRSGATGTHLKKRGKSEKKRKRK